MLRRLLIVIACALAIIFIPYYVAQLVGITDPRTPLQWYEGVIIIVFTVGILFLLYVGLSRLWEYIVDGY